MNSKLRFREWVLWILACVAISVPVAAQTVRGRLTGHIVDQSGAVVPGVSVTIKNAATGEQLVAITDEQGGFVFPSIGLGTYNLETALTGFKRAEARDIVVEVGKPAIVNITLEVGALTDQVVVTGQAQQEVNTVSATLTSVVSTRQVADLPLPTRNPVDLARLQPGIAVDGTNTRTASVGGLRGSATNVTQDGVNAMDNFVKTDSFFALTAPSLASTEEFSVTVGTVGSDSGKGVAQVRMVTKSGTNDLRGQVFWQHRNDVLEANSYFNNTSGTAKPHELQNWLGLAVGGPAWFPKIYDGRNKSFWFFSYEGFREKFQATRNRTVLTDQARQGIFRYVGADGNEKSVDLLSIGSFKSLNPITSGMLKSTPLPNNTEVGDGLNTAGWRFNVAGTDPSDKYVGRFDQELAHSQRWGFHKLEFVYNRAEFLLTPDTFNSIEAPFPGGLNAFQSSVRTLMAVAIHSSFGSHITNEARFGHQRAPVGFLRDGPPATPFLTTFASAAAGTGFRPTSPDNTFMSQGRTSFVYQFMDNFAWIRGKHTIRTGMDLTSLSAITYNDAGIWPAVTLGSNTANSDGILSSGFPSLPSGSTGTAIVNRAKDLFADVTGLLRSGAQSFNATSPTSGFVGGASNSRVYRQRLLALYLQDEWRVRRNLTANFGLRWELQGVPYERHGLALQPVNTVAGLWGISGVGNLFKPGTLKGTAPQPIDFVNGDTGKDLYNTDYNNLAPFVGIAYQPRFSSGPLQWLFGGENKSSIRAGYSISYLQDGWTVVTNAVNNPGLNQGAANNSPTGVLTTAGVPVPVPTFTMPTSDANNFALNSGAGMWSFDPNIRSPYVQQWSIGMEREVAPGWVLEARYVANHAIKIFRAIDFNEVNIFENGFLQEFLNAKTNLALNGGKSFAPTAAGSIPLPIFSTLFNGLAASSGFGSSTFINYLNLGNVGQFASDLAFQTSYKANRANLTFNGNPAPNFFVANPNAAFVRALSNASFSNYNSMQLELRKRMSHGFYLQAGYTFSKVLTDSEGSQSTLESPRTLRNLKLDKHRASYDQTHRFIGNFLYELPFGTGKRWFSGGFAPLRKVVEGWQIGSIISMQTGGPVSIYSNRSTYNNFNPGLNTAQLTGITFEQLKNSMGVYKTAQGVFFIDPNLLNINVNPTTGKLIDARLKDGILGAPLPGSFGNMPRANITGPLFTQFDFSITKRTYFMERRSVDLKVNFLNAFNHPNFTFGSATFDDANFARINGQKGGARVITFILTLTF